MVVVRALVVLSCARSWCIALLALATVCRGDQKDAVETKSAGASWCSWATCSHVPNSLYQLSYTSGSTASFERLSSDCGWSTPTFLDSINLTMWVTDQHSAQNLFVRTFRSSGSSWWSRWWTVSSQVVYVGVEKVEMHFYSELGLSRLSVDPAPSMGYVDLFYEITYTSERIEPVRAPGNLEPALNFRDGNP